MMRIFNRFFVLFAACSLSFGLTSVPALATALKDYRGYLLDKQCSDSVSADSSALEFIKDHTRDCCLMLNCQQKGYCLYSDGKWLSLDAKGNKLAIAVLKRSHRNSAIYVLARGVARGGLLAPASISEIEEPGKDGHSGDDFNVK